MYLIILNYKVHFFIKPNKSNVPSGSGANHFRDAALLSVSEGPSSSTSIKITFLPFDLFHLRWRQ